MAHFKLSEMDLLGKALRFLYGYFWQPSFFGDSDSLGPHSVSAATVGVSALAQDLLNFEITSKVPEKLSTHVVSSRKSQVSWYKELLAAWKESKSPPTTPEEAARLVLQILNKHQKADAEGLLAFYGLPLPHTLVETTAEVPARLPRGVVFEFHTLPMGTASLCMLALPMRENRAWSHTKFRSQLLKDQARAQRDYSRADALLKTIADAGYRVINVQNEEVLARKYRIRLRGIDAPEGEMPYGKEVKDELAKIVQGKCLRVLVYGEDRYGRHVGDVYCDNIFVQGLLAFYGLPLPHTLVETTAEVPAGLPRGVVFEFHTLPVDARCVTDGDDITVYVSTSDARESCLVPHEVQIAAVERSEARAQRDYSRANALLKTIADAGYRVINVQNEEVLARKYRIRLRGIDAPEGEMPYGKEAKDELAKIVQGKCLRVLVYGEDRYGRHVGDVYCDSIFVQELMLKKGMVWHYAAYDQRAEFAEWQRNARAKRVGLWDSANPEEPWEWRKNKREGRRLNPNVIQPFAILG